jgi:hypothetical protein
MFSFKSTEQFNLCREPFSKSTSAFYFLQELLSLGTGVTPCSLARGSSVQPSEHHKRLGDVLTSKSRRRPRVNEQQVLNTVYQLPRFYSRIPVQPTAVGFYFFRDFAFSSFTLWISPYGRSPTFMFHRDAF